MINETYFNADYINYGIATFDNLASSFLTNFIMVTEAWAWNMFNLMDADLPLIGSFYCITLLVIGYFILMNLILAVIIQSFIKAQKREIEAQLQEISDEMLQDELDDDIDGDGVRDGDVLEEEFEEEEVKKQFE